MLFGIGVPNGFVGIEAEIEEQIEHVFATAANGDLQQTRLLEFAFGITGTDPVCIAESNSCTGGHFCATTEECRDDLLRQ